LPGGLFIVLPVDCSAIDQDATAKARADLNNFGGTLTRELRIMLSGML